LNMSDDVQNVINQLSALKTEEWQNFSIDCIMSWVQSNDRFADFIKKNLSKVKKRIRDQYNNEALADVRCELEVAYFLLADNHFDIIQYERKYEGFSRGPDYYVGFDSSFKFNLEVTRLHQPAQMLDFERIIQQVAKRVESVPSSLCFGFYCENIEFDRAMVDRLALLQESIVEYVIKTIQVEEARFNVDEAREYEIPDFGDTLLLRLSKPHGKTGINTTSYGLVSQPILYKGAESLKIISKIIDVKNKITQMIPNMINILAISSESDAHETNHFLKACVLIDRQLRKGDGAFFVKYGFKEPNEFLKLWVNFSGILFREKLIRLGNNKHEDRNVLWQNAHAAIPIPQPLRECLRRMDKPRHFQYIG